MIILIGLLILANAHTLIYIWIIPPCMAATNGEVGVLLSTRAMTISTFLCRVIPSGYRAACSQLSGERQIIICILGKTALFHSLTTTTRIIFTCTIYCLSSAF